MTNNQSMQKGARVRRSKRPDADASPVTRSSVREHTLNSEAYFLARANAHKGWARRWLRQNGHWL